MKNIDDILKGILCEEDIFINIIKQIVIYKDGRILVEFINGITMEEDHEKIREDE